jgi:hypothetical protein
MSPFSGSIEFKLTVRAFEKRVIRSAQINYGYTPAWPYYDAQSREKRTGVTSLDFGLSLLASCSPIRSALSDPTANRRAVLGSSRSAANDWCPSH